MFSGKPNTRKPLWMSLASLTLLLMMGSLTMTSCGLIKPISESTPQEENQSTENDSVTGADQEAAEEKTEAEKGYEAEGIDTTDDDDPE
ncbi:MAG: hypothetical protein ACOC2Z_19070 [Coleofasciculus sp.]